MSDTKEGGIVKKSIRLRGEIVRQVNVISNMEEEMDDKEIPVH